MFYIEVFFITLLLSTFFALGGMGSAVALVPILNFLGISFNTSKAIGLFVNTSTTLTATLMNLKRKTLNIKEALPLALSMAFLAPVGAILSKYIPEHIVKILFALFLTFSASMILFGKKEKKFNKVTIQFMILLGSFVGILSGLLGVGGGAIVVPSLIMMGMDAKKVAVITSFVIPFSTFTAFLTYLSITKIDFYLLLIATAAAILGGYIGNHIMHFKLNQKQIKKIIAIMLYILAIKMIWNLLK